MSIDLSPLNERFLDHVVARGVFHNRVEALDEAVDLLRKRQEFLDHVDEGTRQLRNGEGIELRGEAQLQTLFDRIETEGMVRCKAAKNTR